MRPDIDIFVVFFLAVRMNGLEKRSSFWSHSRRGNILHGSRYFCCPPSRRTLRFKLIGYRTYYFSSSAFRVPTPCLHDKHP